LMKKSKFCNPNVSETEGGRRMRSRDYSNANANDYANANANANDYANANANAND
jgi:hypothetical protein